MAAALSVLPAALPEHLRAEVIDWFTGAKSSDVTEEVMYDEEMEDSEEEEDYEESWSSSEEPSSDEADDLG